MAVTVSKSGRFRTRSREPCMDPGYMRVTFDECDPLR
jgi:hypothetical protein